MGELHNGQQHLKQDQPGAESGWELSGKTLQVHIRVLFSKTMAAKQKEKNKMVGNVQRFQ